MTHFEYNRITLRTHPKFVAEQEGSQLVINGRAACPFLIAEIEANPKHFMRNLLAKLKQTDAVAVAVTQIDGKEAVITFSADQWALGAGERARYAAFADARVRAVAEEQRLEREFDRANNDGGEGYNPYRAGAAHTYRAR